MSLQVSEIDVIFPGRGRGESDGLHVLRRISLTIGDGSFTTLVGPSGCGKSTLLQIMAGLMQGSSGEVSLDGASYNSPPSEVIYLFQQYTRSLMPWLTVRENVAFGLRMRGTLPKRDIGDRVSELIGIVGLTGFEDFFPRQISGGMQQRVAIARALACQPRILLMDEPFSSVDALTRASLQDELLRLWDRIGLTVVFVTHDIDEAIYLGQRVLVLGGRPAEIIEDVKVDLPRSRNQIETKEHVAFLEHRHHLLTAIYANPSA